MKLTGRSGVLRILDSSATLHGEVPLFTLTPDMVFFNGGVTWTNITTYVAADDADILLGLISGPTQKVFAGSTAKFGMVRYMKGGGSNYGAGAGALTGFYINSNNQAVALTGLVDGTAVAGNAFAQDGYITFKIPRDWGITANSYNNNLDAGKYYVYFMIANIASIAPDADIFCPCDGQYFEIAFSAMDFSGPIGRKLQGEILVLDRNTMGSRGHYIKGADDPLYEPMEVSFSCAIDDTYNKDDIMEALACGDPDSTYWTATGTSSKGDTKNDGSVSNPSFVDTNKKCVNLQILWTGSYPVGMAYYECYFPLDQVTVAEAEDGITLSAKGGVYGVIETIHGFGNRY